jgi:hypothetical protein
VIELIFEIAGLNRSPAAPLPIIACTCTYNNWAFGESFATLVIGIQIYMRVAHVYPRRRMIEAHARLYSHLYAAA